MVQRILVEDVPALSAFSSVVPTVLNHQYRKVVDRPTEVYPMFVSIDILFISLLILSMELKLYKSKKYYNIIETRHTKSGLKMIATSLDQDPFQAESGQDPNCSLNILKVLTDCSTVWILTFQVQADLDPKWSQSKYMIIISLKSTLLFPRIE